MPHGMCYLWNPGLLALHVASDAIIAFAYFSIPGLLIYFIRKRRDLPFGWVFWMFGAFIVGCGMTHVFEIYTIWHPVYWLSGTLKAFTAAASLVTAIMLVPLIPRALQYRSPSQLAQDSARYLQFVATASERFSQAKTLQATLDALLDIVVPELADCVLINLAGIDGTLQTCAVRAVPGKDAIAAQLLSVSYARPDGPLASKAAMATGQTQRVDRVVDEYIRDVVAEPYVHVFEELKLQSALALPLAAEHGMVGTLCIFRCDPSRGPFNEAEIALCEALAGRAIIAIGNARLWDKLAYAAYHDSLTGLPNRTVLADRLTETISRTLARHECMAAVLFVDIDRFKLINDSLGHVIGDRLLAAIARRLETCVRANDTVARVSGDEFAVLMPDIEHERDAIHIAERILGEFAHPFDLDGVEVFATASIGVVMNAGSYVSSEEMMRDADIAMYRAKILGKQRFTVFEPLMRDDSHKRLQLETELRHAVTRGEIEVHYQPIVSLDTGKVCAVEALARWRHPRLGLVPPDEFIPIAEETGMIVDIGAEVLLAACTQMRIWRGAAPYACVAVNVNVSAKQMRESNFAQLVERVMHDTATPAGCLHLEITESMLMEEQTTVASMLRELRTLGVRINVDDFGTGYSSLAYLHTFPLDTLKIDRTFVSSDGEGVGCPEIVRTILALAKNLDLDVVAEGVETATQERELRELGCSKAQGFHYARPMDASSLTRHLADVSVTTPPPAALDATAAAVEG